MVFCTYCGQQHQNADDLNHHIMTHVEHFRCSTCNIRFRSHDLLIDHEKIHQRISVEIDTANASSGPKLIACTACARAKTKCDRGVPSCSRCLIKNLVCEVRATRRPESSRPAVKRQRKSGNWKISTDTQDRSQDQSQSVQPEDAPPVTTIVNYLPVEPSTLPVQASAPDTSRDDGEQPVPSGNMSTDQYWQVLADQSVPCPENSLDHMDPLELSMADLSAFGAPDLFFSPQHDATTIIHGAAREPPKMVHGIYGFPERPSISGNESVLFDGSRTISSLTVDSSTSSLLPSTRTESECMTPEDINTELSLPPTSPEEWPTFRCNPQTYSKIDPRIGRNYLEGLKRALRTDSGQNANAEADEVPDPAQYDKYLVKPFNEGLRDQLMGIAQCFLVKSWETHGYGPLQDPKAMVNRSSGIVTLPPLVVLHRYFQSYACRYEPYYAVFPSSQYNTSTMMGCGDERVSGLMLLLMIAQGALSSPATDARSFASGIAEACRLGMQDLVEKDVSLTVQPDMLRCMLLFINLGSWCGARWHMDIAAGQHAMFLSMLKQSGILLRQGPKLPEVDDTCGLEISWRMWKEHESNKRLAYAWLLVDQELSLFQDMSPQLSLSDIQTTMPADDTLWRADTAEEWIQLVIDDHENATASQNNLTLPGLFRRFMSDGASMTLPRRGLSPLQLRLLLHPLQRLICNVHECFSCFSDGGNNRQAQRLMSQFEDVQAILQQWYILASRAPQKPTYFCPATAANLITFHLMSLNTMTCFTEMETLARGDTSPQSFRGGFWARTRLIDEKPQILVHCGQVMNVARMIPQRCRPPWWPAAIYRVSITMWATCIANPDATVSAKTASEGSSLHLAFPLDRLMPEHSSIVRYMRFREGEPMLTRKNGGMSALTPENVLEHCLEVLEEGGEVGTMAMVRGIHGRLQRLAQRSIA